MTKTNEVSVGAAERTEPKRKSVTLTAGGNRLTILAMRKADDTATVFVQTTDAKTKKNTRGMTKKFETFDLAVAALKTLEDEAASKGWKKSTRSGGFKSRPDSFSSMPAAPKAGGR